LVGSVNNDYISFKANPENSFKINKNNKMLLDFLGVFWI
jgi:hypothetical protein